MEIGFVSFFLYLLDVLCFLYFTSERLFTTDQSRAFFMKFENAGNQKLSNLKDTTYRDALIGVQRIFSRIVIGMFATIISAGLLNLNIPSSLLVLITTAMVVSLAITMSIQMTMNFKREYLSFVFNRSSLLMYSFPVLMLLTDVFMGSSFMNFLLSNESAIMIVESLPDLGLVSKIVQFAVLLGLFLFFVNNTVYLIGSILFFALFVFIVFLVYLLKRVLHLIEKFVGEKMLDWVMAIMFIVSEGIQLTL